MLAPIQPTWDLCCRIGQISKCLAWAFLILFLLPDRLIADDSNRPISFTNDVMPVFTKAGCNAGVCHAKTGGGQNGFQLSLLGFEPKDDFESLTKSGKGRRLFPAAPESSLLLKKASGETPHGGGVRLKRESAGYQVLRDWIQQGAKYDASNEKLLTSVAVIPGDSVIAMNREQPLKVLATYSDGSQRDVTEWSLFESNSRAMASVSEEGVVKAHDIPGRIAIMVRYQGQVSVFTAAIPLGAPVGALPTPNNFVDKLVFQNLKQIGIPPSPVCDDATFIRRVTLDVIGRLPNQKETEDFLAQKDPQKRAQLIERLLKNPGYADYFASKWTPLLKNRRDEASDITANFAFHAWIRDGLLANRSYDQMVRELLAATGTVVGNPPVAWYKRVKDPKEQLEDVAQLFLGVRMQCAQCHHHPFEKWSQNDYYSFAAFFSRIGRKPTGIRGEDLIFHDRGVATAKNVKTGIDLKPAALGDSVGVISADQDPRLKLAAWMSGPKNPYFSKAVVNRYWKHFFKRGLIEPEDDIRDTNPPTNPKLLSALEQHFIQSGFDLKELVRVITNSKTYQLSAIPNRHNLKDSQNYSRFYPRRLQAEVLLDAIDDLAGTRTSFANLPLGTRAIALPDNSYNKASSFLRIFGRPESLSVCECERVRSSSLAQSLHLINSTEIKTKLSNSSGTAAKLAKSNLPAERRVQQIYLAAFSRPANPAELKTCLDYLYKKTRKPDGTAPAGSKTSKPKPNDPPAKIARAEFEDLIWALMNTKEFLFNH